MQVSKDDVFHYLTTNTSKRVYITNNESGAVHMLETLPDNELKIQGYDHPAYNIYIADTEVEIISGTYGDMSSWFATLSKETVEEIKKWYLTNDIKNTMVKLLPAAKEMIAHYNSIPSGNGKYRVDVYFLKHIDFTQGEKGSVIIVPRSSKNTAEDYVIANNDIIKGYIICPLNGSVKWETVQAWRYQYQSPRIIQGCALGGVDLFEGWQGIRM